MNQPAAIYDLAVVASILGKYNARSMDTEGREMVEQDYTEALEVLRYMKEKPLLPHTNPTTLQESSIFLSRVQQILHFVQRTGVAHQTLVEETRKLLAHVACKLDCLSHQSHEEWFVGAYEIDAMMGLPVSAQENHQVINDEIARWMEYEKCPVPSPLTERVSICEIKNIISSGRSLGERGRVQFRSITRLQITCASIVHIMMLT